MGRRSPHILYFEASIVSQDRWFRDDYLQSLRALTRRERAAPLVRALVRAQKFSHLEFSPYPRILKELTGRNWFREPDEARIID